MAENMTIKVSAERAQKENKTSEKQPPDKTLGVGIVHLCPDCGMPLKCTLDELDRRIWKCTKCGYEYP